MDVKTVGTIANVLLMTGYAIGAAWRGYQRRRKYWTQGSWVGFSSVVLLGLAIIACGFRITLAVDNHEAWVGMPHSDTRSFWALVALGSLTGGVLAVAGALGWLAVGDPRRQLPVLGRWRVARRAAPEHVRVGEAHVDTSAPSA